MPARTIQPAPGRFRSAFGLKKMLVINLAIVALVSWGFSGEYLRNRQMEAEIDRLRDEAVQLEQRNSELSALRERFASGVMLEREARAKLNMRRPGEEVVVVRSETVAAAPASSAPSASRRDTSPNHVKWWHYFFE